MTQDKILLANEVLEQIKVSRVTLYKMIEEKEFPPPTPLRNKSAWFQSDVEAYKASLKEARNESSEYQRFIESNPTLSCQDSQPNPASS